MKENHLCHSERSQECLLGLDPERFLAAFERQGLNGVLCVAAN